MLEIKRENQAGGECPRQASVMRVADYVVDTEPTRHGRRSVHAAVVDNQDLYGRESGDLP